MLLFLRARTEARQLARQLRQSMVTEPELWEIDADRQGRPLLTKGRFRIALVPRAVRLFDAVHLYCDEVEVWLPLLPRIRLRASARFIITRFALDQWATPRNDRHPRPVSATKVRREKEKVGAA